MGLREPHFKMSPDAKGTFGGLQKARKLENQKALITEYSRISAERRCGQLIWQASKSESPDEYYLPGLC
jgi:hypothetical protein